MRSGGSAEARVIRPAIGVENVCVLSPADTHEQELGIRARAVVEVEQRAVLVLVVGDARNIGVQHQQHQPCWAAATPGSPALWLSSPGSRARHRRAAFEPGDVRNGRATADVGRSRGLGHHLPGSVSNGRLFASGLALICPAIAWLYETTMRPVSAGGSPAVFEPPSTVYDAVTFHSVAERKSCRPIRPFQPAGSAIASLSAATVAAIAAVATVACWCVRLLARLTGPAAVAECSGQARCPVIRVPEAL